MLETFAKGLRTSPVLGQRGFIAHPPNQYSSRYTLQIGNARVWLDEADTIDLCAAADQWVLSLRAAYRKLNRAWNSTGFKVFPESRHAVLGIITQEAWQIILAFARAHDYATGETAWHVLDARSSALLVYAPETRGDLSAGHHLWVTGVQADTSRKVKILWHPPFNGGSTLDDGYWGVNTAHRWLMQKLVPAAFGWAHRGNHSRGLLGWLFRPNPLQSSPLEETTLIELALARHTRPSELAQTVAGGKFEPLMQAIHSALSDQTWNLPLPTDALSRIASAILVYLEVWQDEHLGYIISNLGLTDQQGINELRSQIAVLGRAKASRTRLKYAGAALIDAAAKTDGRLGSERTGRILHALRPLIRYADALEEIRGFEFT